MSTTAWTSAALTAFVLLTGPSAAQTTDPAAPQDAEPAICLAAGESEAKCECQAKSLATVFDADEMAAITQAADAADYPAVTAAVTKGIGIDQNKNDFYKAAVESCAGL